MRTATRWRLDAVRSSVAFPHRCVVARLLLLLSPHQNVRGFDVYALTGNLTAAATERVDEALSLIQKSDPIRWRRMRADLKRILIIASGGPEYWPFANGFTIEQDSVDRSDAVSLALVMVHESTHARLWNAGHRYTHGERARIEAICVRAEVDFARRLALSSARIEEVMAQLERPWWTDDEVRERQRRARETLWPRWLQSLSSALRRQRGSD